MAEPNHRIDKWLWCVRLYKTRTEATDAVNGGKVKLNNANTKPSRELKPGDIIEFKKGIITRTYKVIDFPKNRLPAKEITAFLEDLTPDTELVKLEDLKYMQVVKRDKGAGRPSKKERRDMGKFLND